MRTIYRVCKETGELYVVPEAGPAAEQSAYVMPDLDRVYGDWRSPVDGSVITSRSQLREHNRRNDTFQCGDVRGQAVRDQMKKHMKYDPELRKPGSHFSWTDPSR